MDSQQFSPGQGFGAPDKNVQRSIERWQTGVGKDRQLSRDWMKGADGFLSHASATEYLVRVLDLYDRSKKSPTAYGAMWGLMQDKRAVAQVAAETLIHVISHNLDGRKRNSIAAEIGKRAEFVLWLCHPMWRGSLHLKGLRLANGRALDMSLLKKRLIDSGFEKAKLYKPLTKTERLKLGTLFLEIASTVTGLFTFEVEAQARNRKALVCRMTSHYWEFLRNWQRNLALFRPVMVPMVIPPLPWKGIDDGGYLTLGTTSSTVPWERFPVQIKHAKPCVLGSINYLQGVAFTWNHWIFELQQEIWDLGHEIGSLPCRERMERPSDAWYRQQAAEKGTQQSSAYWTAFWKFKADQRKNTRRQHFINSLVTYQRMKDFERIWFVWFSDNRGRKYQRGAQINYQGADVNRAQLMFDRPCPVYGHEEELMWAIRDAAGVEKDTDSRYLYCGLNLEMLTRIGTDPLDCIGAWENTKEPWRFVALCHELANYKADDEYQTRMVFQLDQSCSGYGHVACLLRDQELAWATNCIGHEYRDLYGKVLDNVEFRMGEIFQDEKEIRCKDWWVDHGIPRKLIKSCVMPLIYGQSTQTRHDLISVYCRDIIGHFLTEDGLRVVDLANYLNRRIQLAIKSELPGVLDLYKWLRKAAKVCVDHGLPPSWLTPNGWTVMSYGMEVNNHEMFLELSGRRLRVNCGVDDGPISHQKCYNRVVADFVHSQDAAFLERFIWHWKTFDYPIVAVHDCLGTSLDKVNLLNKELCDQFSRFYSVDYLAMVKQQVEKRTNAKLPAIPYRNTLNTQKIGQNPFLFC